MRRVYGSTLNAAKVLAASLACILACLAQEVAMPPENAALDMTGSGEQIGSGDGRIHVIPTLSAPSVKNGGKLTVSAVVKAQAGVHSVVADMGGVETITLKPTAGALGGVSADGSLGMWSAEWTAHSLEEKMYTVTLRVTDRAGHVFVDRSLEFSDPIAGLSTPGGTAYPNGGVQRLGALTLNSGENDLRAAVIDTSGGYAYVGTTTSPGIVVKIALGGAGPPTRVGALTLNAGESQLKSAVIDAVGGYAYFGTDTNPGIVVKVALGAGAALPTRVGAITLNSGEDRLLSAVIDVASGYAYFGCATVPAGIVVKVALGAGAAPPTRVGAVTLTSAEYQIVSAVIDVASGYAYFGTLPSPANVVKVALGAGATPPTRVGALTLNSGENFLHSAVIDAASGYAYFGCANTPGRAVKVALGAGAALPTRVGTAMFNTGEDNARSAVIDLASGYAYFGTITSPGRVAKIALGGAGAPTRVGGLTLNTGENDPFSAVIDPASGYAYFGTVNTSPAILVKIALSQKGQVKGTRMSLGENASVTDVRFYSHTASGNLWLGIYDNASPKNLLWESASVANTSANADLILPISSGTPASLNLTPGTYWLAWQVDTTADVPSYTAGSAGDGFYLDQAYGTFPGTITGETSSSERWTQYITYATTTKTWNGGGANDNWSNPANWSGGVAPVAGDNLIFSGTVRLTPNNDFAANTSFASITFNAGGFTLGGNTVTLTGGASAIGNTSGTNTINNNITFSTVEPTITAANGTTLTMNDAIDNGGLMLTTATAGTLNLNGVISGAGGLTKTGTGTLQLAGAAANTYSGMTTVNDGLMQLNKSVSNGAIPGALTIGDGVGAANSAVVQLLEAEQLANTSAVTINSDGQIDLNGFNETIGSLAGAGNVALGAGTLTAGGDNTSTTFSGIISGTGSLIKTGTGTLTLTGASTYSGGTNISAGELLANNVTGSATGSGPLVVASGVELNGNGTIAGPVTVNNGGSIAPGSGGGGKLDTGALTLNPSSVLNFELADPASITDDELAVTGNLTLDGTLNVSALPGFAGGVYTLLTYTGTLTDNGLSIGTMPAGYGGTINTATAGQVKLVVAAIPPPTVTAVNPNSGSSLGGISVTITGTNFVNGATATFGGTAATGVTVQNSTTITATTPAHAPGAVDVVVTTANGSGTLASGFTYNSAPAPTLSDITPKSGPIAGGTAITITGTNFASGAAVTIGGAAATNVSVVSATQITATSPAHAAGTLDVVVTNADSQSATLSAGFIAFDPALAPTVSGVSPAAGSTAGGTAVTITGTNFVSGASATIGGTAATNVAIVSATQITATTPAHAAGAVDIVVTNLDTQLATLAGGYTFVAPPVITSAASASGKLGSAFSYSITASNSPASFNATGLPAGLSVDTGTGAISGTPSAVGKTDATISATNAGGTGTAALSITISPSGPPNISSVSSSQNPAKTNTSVTFTANAGHPDNLPLTFTWEFGDGSASVGGSGAQVSHAFGTEANFTVKVSVSDGFNAVSSSLSQSIFAPASGGTPGDNTSTGSSSSNVYTDIEIKVLSSEGGVVEFQVLKGGQPVPPGYVVTTVISDANGPLATITGDKPVYKFTAPGIYTATATVKDSADQLAGETRITVVVGSGETGGGGGEPGTTPPASKDVTVLGLGGKFRFRDNKPDSIQFKGHIELPGGLVLAKERLWWCSVGNVTDTVTVDVKGRAKLPGAQNRLTKMKAKMPRLKKPATATSAGQRAGIQFTISVPDLDDLGFATEGIRPVLAPGEENQKSVKRFIQVAMLFAGYAYQGKAPVEFKLSKNRDSGQVKFVLPGRR